MNFKGEINNKLKISIIEDSKIHREWLKTEISFDSSLEVISLEKQGKEGLEKIKQINPNLVILDFQLEDMTGIEIAKRIKGYNNKIKIFIITAHTEISIVERLIADKHIDAIAIKGSHYFEDNFITAIKYVANGGNYLDPSLLKKLRESKSTNGLGNLTRREFEIFIQSNTGKSDEKIASDLFVELQHVKNIKSKIAKKIKKDKLENILSKLIENSKPDCLKPFN